MVFKLDVRLEKVEEHNEAASSLKAGNSVDLRRDPEGTIACTCSGGAVVGVVPAEHVRQLSSGAHFTGSVRSVRRIAGEATVVELLVRFTAGQPPPLPPPGADSHVLRFAAYLPLRLMMHSLCREI